MGAFEKIVTRDAGTAAAVIDRYFAVGYDADGLLAKATAAMPFAGITQYGSTEVGGTLTFVEGVFPGYVTEEVSAGDKLVLDAAAAGKFKKAGASALVYGIAMSDAAADGLAAIRTLKVPFTTAGA